MKSKGYTLVLCLLGAMLFVATTFAQETTGGLQGTVKDASGAVVPTASITLKGSTLIGEKTQTTDASGYYRFANLPPGNYTMTVTAKGFTTLKRSDINIEVGHLPTLDLALKVGSTETVVEVSSEAPVIDVTTTRTMTNVTQDVISNIPHGTTFQSVIQFAPSARNEPLAGAGAMAGGTSGTGGSLPGSSGNGLSYGFSVGGAADSENSYLVEGQDTANIAGGFSTANVPFEFIQEVQVKTSGIEAEHGGALGGVVNVVMKKGGNSLHGELFSTYQGSAMDAAPNSYLRYNPDDQGNPAAGLDQASQLYQPTKDHYRFVDPGVTLGGPIVKDRLWFFLGFNPYYSSDSRVVDFQNNDGNLGKQTFMRDQQTYYTNGRLDANVSQKVRVFASWLSQYSRLSGVNLPNADSIQGYTNTSITSPITLYSHGLGFSAPNQTVNFGGDITITPRLVATTRFGYFFQNYHDFGWPTSGTNYDWITPGSVGGVPQTDLAITCSDPTTCPGQPFPDALAMPQGTQTVPYSGTYTQRNANKHWQFNQDFALFKSGWLGTHNFKFGYQYNRMSNDILQSGNVPLVRVYLDRQWGALTQNGAAACAALETSQSWETNYKSPLCAGQEGYLRVQDFATIGNATDTNHALFFQDAWTIGKGLTIDAGLRIEKEQIPAPPGNVLAGHTINFSWSDKVEPRVGAAWDVFQNGKMKVFGSYGVVNDVMKLLLAMTSFGGQAYEDCAYALQPNFDPSKVNLDFANGRACPNGPATTDATWTGGTVPDGLSLIENVNLRPFEPVAPGVKPYRQHESTFGVDYQLSRTMAFEARWDRRRLDHILEDASLTDVNWGETYTIVNPGEGVNKTINGYAQYLGSLGEVFGVPGWSFDTADFGTCNSCPNNPKAVRNYDGLELRLTRSMANHWGGFFSYTYSSLRGNYTGLTTTDQTDGAETGRNSPDTSRAFDEPMAYFTATGASSNGPLPTDRPNTFKGYAYYQLNEGKRNATTFGLFQQFYQGTPKATYLDVGSAYQGQPSYAQYIYGRGKWLDPSNIQIDPNTGAITLSGTPTSSRTPWFIQSDLNLQHEIKVSSVDENKVLAFQATFTNLFNQKSVTDYYMGLNSVNFGTALYPDAASVPPAGPGLPPGYNLNMGAIGYQAAETGYNIQNDINPSGVIVNSQYGKPVLFQLPRTVRFEISFKF